MKKKIFLMTVLTLCIAFLTKGVYAASASISANKTSVTVGTKVTVTVKVTAAAWNLSISGSASDSIVGFNMDAVNQTTTKTYSINTSKAGTYKVSLTGDITDQSSETATSVSKSVTITVKEKPVEQKPTTNTTTNNTTTNKPATTTKSSNANAAKISLGVEGFSFKKSQTVYNLKVGTDINNITVSVTPEHKKATYTISGNKNLKAGNNVIKVVIKAENGATKTYKINVEKEGDIEESSSALTNLIIENMTFEESFQKTVTEYVGSKMKYTDKLNILVYPEAEQATYEVFGNENLKVGENEITILVTSKDETSTTKYIVKFEMLSKEETDALQTVSPYVEQDNTSIKDKEELKWQTELWNTVKENSTVILLYLLALVEFVQVVYLYTELEKIKNVNAPKETRRKANKEE